MRNWFITHFPTIVARKAGVFMREGLEVFVDLRLRIHVILKQDHIVLNSFEPDPALPQGCSFKAGVFQAWCHTVRGFVSIH